MPENLKDKHRAAFDLYLKQHKKTVNWSMFETTALRKDKSIIDVEISFSEINYRKETIFIGIIRDVSEKKLLLKEIEEKNEQLLNNDKQKNEFIALLAHELRNPLSPILNAISLIKYKKDDPEIINKVVNIVERQVNSLSKMINDLLDVSKIIRGRVGLSIEQVDLCSFIRDCITDYEAIIKNRNIRLTIDIKPSPIYVFIDKVRMRQIFGNIILNAIKFSNDHDKILISVSDDSRRAYLVITDSGIGIEAEKMNNLFNNSQTFDKKADGIGIGLSVIKKLVEAHSGEFNIFSEGKNKGTRATVSLPLEKEYIVSNSDENIDFSVEGERILLIDDNRDNLESLKDMLEILGHIVFIANCGIDGLKILEKEKVNIVICDIGLPELDGYGVARAIRSIPSYDNIKLLALSGYGGVEDKIKSKEAGFLYHLTKPVSPNQLQYYIKLVSDKGNMGIIN
jgi:signal transduction histidine kinase/CheY-like chemotaxis protein